MNEKQATQELMNKVRGTPCIMCKGKSDRVFVLRKSASGLIHLLAISVCTKCLNKYPRTEIEKRAEELEIIINEPLPGKINLN